MIPAPIPVATRELLRRDMDYDRDFWGKARDPFEQAGACQSSLQRRVIEATPRIPPPVAEPATTNKAE